MSICLVEGGFQAELKIKLLKQTDLFSFKAGGVGHRKEGAH